MFLPTTREECRKRGWEALDIILITGDTYIDDCFNGTAVIGRYLESHGFRVGLIAQPDINSSKDILRLGEPELYWGVSAGCVDSIVANYTALHKKRKSDDFTPGGINDRRPDYAVIRYTNLIKQYSKEMKPVIIGGIEASLRRCVHFDFLKERLRRSILLDAKADCLIYGMGEKQALLLTKNLRKGKSISGIPGTVSTAKEKPKGFQELTAWEDIEKNPALYSQMFTSFYKLRDKNWTQKCGGRYLVQYAPPKYNPDDLDEIHSLPFEREVHPWYLKKGQVKAIETTRFSVITHRGCFGGCSFCAIHLHQGHSIISRSERSILTEVKKLTVHKKYRGTIYDLGGPTANMYGMEKAKDHSACISLLDKVRKIDGVKHAFVRSGLRYDLVLRDKDYGHKYLDRLVNHHISGQLKIAPEHNCLSVLKLMGKKNQENLEDFVKLFYQLNKKAGKKLFLTYYLMAAHPGCGMPEMRSLNDYMKKILKAPTEQVQVFTPTPSTWSTLQYYLEEDKAGKKIFVEKNLSNKKKQKDLLNRKGNREQGAGSGLPPAAAASKAGKKRHF